VCLKSEKADKIDGCYGTMESYLHGKRGIGEGHGLFDKPNQLTLKFDGLP
jgi:hypothetical protein